MFSAIYIYVLPFLLFFIPFAKLCDFFNQIFYIQYTVNKWILNSKS